MCYSQGGEKEGRERTRERERKREREGGGGMREGGRKRERERERERNSNINFCLFCRLDEQYSTVITPSSPQVLHIDYNKLLSNARTCVFPMLVSILCVFPLLASVKNNHLYILVYLKLIIICM